jgi:hypothetical protein
MKKKAFIVLPVILLALSLVGCGNGSSDLPISTIRFELSSDGFTQFYTNDLPPKSRSIAKDRIYFVMEENGAKKEIFNGAFPKTPNTRKINTSMLPSKGQQKTK